MMTIECEKDQDSITNCLWVTLDCYEEKEVMCWD